VLGDTAAGVHALRKLRLYREPDTNSPVYSWQTLCRKLLLTKGSQKTGLWQMLCREPSLLLGSYVCREQRTSPRQVIIGEFRKTHRPRNVEVNEICDASFQGQGTHEDLEYGIHEVSKSRVRGELDSRTLEVSESRTRDSSES
jgi:hypothetical protein